MTSRANRAISRPACKQARRIALRTRPVGSIPILCRFSPAECPHYETCPFLHKAAKCSGSCPFDICNSCEAPKNSVWKRCGSRIACPAGDYCRNKGCRNVHKIYFYTRCMFTMKSTDKACTDHESCPHLSDQEKSANREYKRDISQLSEYYSIHIKDVFQKAPDLFGAWRRGDVSVSKPVKITRPFGARRTYCEASSPG